MIFIYIFFISMLNYDYIQYIKYIDYNCIKGFKYEYYVLNKLKEYYNTDECYLWKNVPDYLLIESGIILDNDLSNIKKKYNIDKMSRNYNILLDTGIDIICKINSDTILLVQCKAYNSVISQKHLSGFFRTLLDTYLINKNRNVNIKGLIVHTSKLSDLIKESYCYKENLISDMYLPFELNDKKKGNQLIKYKKISVIFMLNFNIIVMYMLYILHIYILKI